MIQVRNGVFETNSSSTHSLVICSADEYRLLKEGKLLIDYDDNVLTLEEALQKLREEKWYNGPYPETPSANWIASVSDEFRTLEGYWDNYLEDFEKKYKTPSGDEIVVFGQYGFDG